MNLIGFLSAAVLLTLMPGPDILFVITQSMTRGKRAGIVFAAGLCSGLIFHTLAVSLGVSLILYESPIAFMVLKVLGASYLIYLSVRTFLRRKDNVFVLSADKEAESRLYRKGVLMNILNPKVLLFFIAFFPQFVSPDADNPTGELLLLLLGALFILQAGVIFSLVAMLASHLFRGLMRRRRFSLVMSVVESLIYFVIGISLMFVNNLH